MHVVIAVECEQIQYAKEPWQVQFSFLAHVCTVRIVLLLRYKDLKYVRVLDTLNFYCSNAVW